MIQIGLFAALLWFFERGLAELHFGSQAWSRRLFVALTVGLCPAALEAFFSEQKIIKELALAFWAMMFWAASIAFERDRARLGIAILILGWSVVWIAAIMEPSGLMAFSGRFFAAVQWLCSLRFWLFLPVFLWFLKRTDLFFASKRWLAGLAFLSAGLSLAIANSASELASYFSMLAVAHPVWDRGLLMGLAFLKRKTVRIVIASLVLAQTAACAWFFLMK